jgi:hypothetical protein
MALYASPSPQPRFAFEVGEAVPRQVDEVGGDLVLLGLADFQPPLAGQRHHADEGLRVQTCQLGVIAAGVEVQAQDVLDLRGDVVEETGEGAGGAGDRGVADHDPEAVAGALDVVEQGSGGLLQQFTRMAVAGPESSDDGVEQVPHLPVDDDGVDAFLATEMLVQNDLLGQHHRVDRRRGDGGREGLCGLHRLAEVLYDAMLRARETQIQTPDNGRTVSDTTYNSIGWESSSTAPYYNSAPVSPTYVEAQPGDVPSKTGTSHDSVGRKTKVTSYASGSATGHPRPIRMPEQAPRRTTTPVR